MNKQQRAVREFHELIGAPVGSRPMMPDLKRRELRAELIREEAMEFASAMGFTYCLDCEAWEDYGNADLVAAADALGDLLVVINGAALELGLDLEPIFDEIHRSNMTKGGGEVRADGKALKGPGYEPPVLAPIIDRQSARDEWDDYPESWVEVDSRIALKPLFGSMEGYVLQDGEWYLQSSLDAVAEYGSKISFTIHRDPGDETNA